MQKAAKIVVFSEKPATSELTLRRAGTLGGVVRLETAHVGLQGVTVRLWNEAWRLCGLVRTDAMGGYRFEGVPPGHYIVSVDMPLGHEAEQEKHHVHVSSAGMMQTTFRLRPARTLRGRIVDPALGTPVSGVGIQVVGANGRTLAESRTGPKGDYEFLDLPLDHYRLRLE